MEKIKTTGTLGTTTLKQQERRIYSVMQELASSAEDNYQMSMSLRDRLSEVSSPPTEACEEGVDKPKRPTIDVPLAEHILQCAEKIRRTTAILEDAAGRLEI